MKKRIVYASLAGAIVLAALVVFLLNTLDVFHIDVRADLGLFFLILMGGFGVLNLVWGLLNKSIYYVFSSALLLAGAFIYIALEWTGLAWYVIVVVSLCILILVGILSFLCIRWKAADEGANDAPEYKNYEQRKAEGAEERERQIAREKKIASGEDEEFQIKSFKPENKDQ